MFRLGVGLELAAYRNGYNSVMMPSVQTDMATYWDISGRIIAGSYDEPLYYQPFYYAAFLPVIRWLLGDTIYAVIVIQALLGGGAVFLVGLCGRRLWNKWAGYIGAGMAALSTILILYTPFLLLEVLQSFWLTLILFLALRGMARRDPVDWALCAVVLGCSILTRGNSWFFVPGLLAASIWSQWLSGTKVGKNILNCFLAGTTFLALVILPQLPFIYYNSQKLGKLSGPSTAAGAVLALGNTPEAPPGGRTPGSLAGPMEYPPTWHEWLKTEQEVSIPQRILEWFEEEPGAFLELTGRKLLLFWDYREIPNNISLAGEGQISKILKFTGIIPTGLIIALAIAGMVVAIIAMSMRQQKLYLLIPLYMVIAYWGATAAFYILCRFRLPVLPLLAVFGGIFPVWFYEFRQKKAMEAYMIGGAAMVFGVFITFSAYDMYRYNFEARVISSVRPNGVRIKMSDGRIMHLDNGPATFGDWQVEEFVPNMVIKKVFSVNKDQVSTAAEFELTLAAEYPGTTVVEINGEKHDFIFEAGGPNTRKFSLDKPGTDTVEVRILSSSQPVFFLIDYQRDYGRTLINNQPCRGELVCRLFRINNKADSIPESEQSSGEAVDIPQLIVGSF